MLKRSISVVIFFTLQLALVFCESSEQDNHKQLNLENAAILKYFIQNLPGFEERNLTFEINPNTTQGNVSVITDIQSSSTDSSNYLAIQLICSSIVIFVVITVCSCCCYHCCCRPTVVEQGRVVIMDESRRRNETLQSHPASPPDQPIYIVQQIPSQYQHVQKQEPMPYQPMDDLPPPYFPTKQYQPSYPMPPQYQPMQMQQQSQYSPVYQQPATVPPKF